MLALVNFIVSFDMKLEARFCSKRRAELSQLGLIFRLGSPMQGAQRGAAGRGVTAGKGVVKVPGELRVAQGVFGMLLPGQQTLFWEQPLPGVAVPHGRLPSLTVPGDG